MNDSLRIRRDQGLHLNITSNLCQTKTDSRDFVPILPNPYENSIGFYQDGRFQSTSRRPATQESPPEDFLLPFFLLCIPYYHVKINITFIKSNNSAKDSACAFFVNLY